MQHAFNTDRKTPPNSTSYTDLYKGMVFKVKLVVDFKYPREPEREREGRGRGEGEGHQ